MNMLKEGSKTLSLNTSDDKLCLESFNLCQPGGKMEPLTKFKQTFFNSNLQLQTSGVESRVKLFFLVNIFTFNYFFCFLNPPKKNQ